MEKQIKEPKEVLGTELENKVKKQMYKDYIGQIRDEEKVKKAKSLRKVILNIEQFREVIEDQELGKLFMKAYEKKPEETAEMLLAMARGARMTM